MPAAFLLFYGKVSRLDKKLELSADTAVLSGSGWPAPTAASSAWTLNDGTCSASPRRTSPDSMRCPSTRRARCSATPNEQPLTTRQSSPRTGTSHLKPSPGCAPLPGPTDLRHRVAGGERAPVQHDQPRPRHRLGRLARAPSDGVGHGGERRRLIPHRARCALGLSACQYSARRKRCPRRIGLSIPGLPVRLQARQSRPDLRL